MIYVIVFIPTNQFSLFMLMLILDDCLCGRNTLIYQQYCRESN